MLEIILFAELDQDAGSASHPVETATDEAVLGERLEIQEISDHSVDFVILLDFVLKHLQV